MDIVISVADWKKWLVDSGLDAASAESLEELLELGEGKNMPVLDLSKMYIVFREEKRTDPEILPPNKRLFEKGAHAFMDLVIARKKRPVQTPKKTVMVREYALPLPGDGPEEQQLLRTGTPEACERATRYLLEQVLAFVMGRFGVIYDGGGSVREAAEALIAGVWKLVDDFEGNGETLVVIAGREEESD